MPPVMAVDLGSATISAAAAQPSTEPDPAVLTVDGRSTYSPATCVDIEGVPHPSTWSGSAVDHTPRPDLLLDLPPQIIGDVPLSGATLVGVAIGPALAAAADHFGTEPTVLIGVHPHWWPAGKIADYERALARLTPHTALIPWPEAIAAQTVPPATASHVTVMDFGASTATITVVSFSRRGVPRVRFTHTDRAGGSRGVDRVIVADAAAEAGIDLSGQDQHWWEEAASQVAASRRRLCTETGSWPAAIDIEFPAPLGARQLRGPRLRQLTTTHMQKVVAGLIAHEDVQSAWSDDRTSTTTQPLVEVTGGFGQDPSVLSAVKAEAGRADLVPEPASAAAFGAVLAHAPAWVPADQKPSRFRFGRSRSAVPAQRARS
ncbi:Hsp70 family protein [Dietzia cinnamea]|uniref:Hsp70 family protein n=1 Tax=Dietzia TaxID=37914 RepID=UPI00101AE02D|nr:MULTISPECIES: Hsp70 family protein [Dietzia]MCT1885256.1 Hsp70 family protein [Dietzia cinnamea]